MVLSRVAVVMTRFGHGLLLFLAWLSCAVRSRQVTVSDANLPPLDDSRSTDGRTCKLATDGERWAVLIAGSKGYGNYRHQADVCHAYQILRKGGMKDENIIVFMYDDIAYDKRNPRPGVIINRPKGKDVYHGVPKDYTGHDATIANLFAVLLGNKSAVTGGSGKVLESGPHDNVFIYYSDHGGPGIVSMPLGMLYAVDLVNVLKKMHHAKAYKTMVFYLEACEGGSVFDGLLPTDLNIYAVTAANPDENSFATYCPGHNTGVPKGYATCLGDLFSVSWMEDSDLHDSREETLQKQYEATRKRTGNSGGISSHVMQYGNKEFISDFICAFMGPKPADDDPATVTESSSGEITLFNQRDASLLHYWHKVNQAAEGTQEKIDAQKELQDEIDHRQHVDSSINQIASLLFGNEKGSEMLQLVRPSGQPLVDDWDCLKMFVNEYQTHCGPLSTYGKKYTRAMANMCNAGVTIEQMVMASTQACSPNI
uniref:Uncharacterized protein MANES_06G178900 n=1 Tax=Rhizophora mucronata TaxID=61149 RepID=A0A2P2NZD1_RHIMU